MEKYLLDEQIHIEAAPPYRQHQNSLVERHLQSILSMSCNWLKSAMLPTLYWFFAVKRSVKVSNIMPFKHQGTVTTPYTLVYKKKLDCRTLIPMFSVSYICQQRENNTQINNWAPKTLKCILVRTCPQSDDLLFYHPPLKQMLTCSDRYWFDPFCPASPQFG